MLKTQISEYFNDSRSTVLWAEKFGMIDLGMTTIDFISSKEISNEKFGTYVLTQPGQNSHKSPNLATLRVIRGFS